MPKRNPSKDSSLPPKSLTVVGIDPGVKGAVAVWHSTTPYVVDCPFHMVKVNKTMRPRCDPAGMAKIIKQFTLNPCHVFLEKVHANPKQGVASMFTFGEALGMWKGILAALQVPYTLVTPQAWQKVTLKGMGKDKDAGRLRVVELWPTMHGELGNKDMGRADALLMAEYGRRELG